MYEIEKDVPVSGVHHDGHGRWKDAVQPMEVGDSFFVPEADFPLTGKNSASAAVHMAAKTLGFKLATRTVKGGMRVWRLE